ncbi:MAG: tRNA (adenosine(37)-N6)-threonylcarbamoyltransferase complex ATPase subunit type 1 TsaE, partial [Patescibacteria group bacterium]
MNIRTITITSNTNEERRATHSVAQTHTLAKRLLKDLHGGDVLALSGELGAGKTTFTQGFAKGLGITTR